MEWRTHCNASLWQDTEQDSNQKPFYYKSEASQLPANITVKVLLKFYVLRDTVPENWSTFSVSKIMKNVCDRKSRNFTGKYRDVLGEPKLGPCPENGGEKPRTGNLNLTMRENKSLWKPQTITLARKQKKKNFATTYPITLWINLTLYFIAVTRILKARTFQVCSLRTAWSGDLKLPLGCRNVWKWITVM